MFYFPVQDGVWSILRCGLDTSSPSPGLCFSCSCLRCFYVSASRRFRVLFSSPSYILARPGLRALSRWLLGPTSWHCLSWISALVAHRVTRLMGHRKLDIRPTMPVLGLVFSLCEWIRCCGVQLSLRQSVQPRWSPWGFVPWIYLKVGLWFVFLRT